MTLKTTTTKRSEWYVYLITDGRRTYVGATTCVRRRLRQHNREIKGGARATKASAGKWKIVCYLQGFQTRREAYRWEAIVKKRARGLSNRQAAMVSISVGTCPEGRKEYTVPEGLVLYGQED